MKNLITSLCIGSLLISSCADMGDTNTRPLETPEQNEAPAEVPNEEPTNEAPELEEPNETEIFSELPPQPYLPETEAIDIALGVLIEGALFPPSSEVEEPPLEGLTRPRRRMDIDQLDAAMERISNGICWTDGNGDCVNDDRLFVRLASSLGKPDFRNSTQEDLSPSALFQKFLGDAARFVCHQMMVRETGDPSVEAILFKHVAPTDTLESNLEGVNQNLSSLILRFHARHVPTDSPRLELWRWLFQTSSYVANDPALAWRNVCVALFSHPDFFTY